MNEHIELAGIVCCTKRIKTEWGTVKISLVILGDMGRKIRLVLPTALPAEFRREAAKAGAWIVEQRGHCTEAVDEIEAALREALSHDIRKDQI